MALSEVCQAAIQLSGHGKGPQEGALSWLRPEKWPSG